jgi:L-lactate dehydrogenase (cytochrome)
MKGVAGAQGDRATALINYANTKLLDPTQSWRDVEWLREVWDGPLAVKGLLAADDGVRAVRSGATAVMVSNHGGRQLDSGPAAIEALPRMVDAIGGDAEILLDGGVRRGSDVVKALALGASACLVGRPYWWALAAGGEAGVDRMLEIFRTEIYRVLALIGRPTLAELDRDVIVGAAARAASLGGTVA